MPSYIYDLADTWNASGTTFTAIKMNVADTASAAGSLLMDLQVGGVSRFRVVKSGNIEIPVGVYIGDIFGSILRATASSINPSFVVGGSGTGFIGWANTNIQTPDITLLRDAADTLAQRRSTNAQTFRLYNTFTDASNYERGKMEWASNVLRIGTEKAGTGTARALEFQTDGTTRLTLAANSNAVTGAVFIATGYLQSPAAALNGNGGIYFGSAPSTRAELQATGVGIMALGRWGTGDVTFQFGGSTSSFPAIKRSTTALQARLADDSAFTNIQGKLTTETAYTAGAPTATGYLVLYDSNGTAYKVPAEAL
jgi:hypothetical protein